MLLSALNQRGVAPSVVIVQCPSNILNLFIEDKIKVLLGSTQDTTFTLRNKKELKDVHMICNVQPFQSKKWLYMVDLDKFSPDKDFYNLVKESSTVCYMLFCSKYSTYKKVKDDLKSVQPLWDFYIGFLKGADMGYLFNEYVVKTERNHLVSREIYQYIKDGYSNDVDAVITLFDYVRTSDPKDKPLTKQKITELCGLGGNTLESFVFTLLKDAPKASKRSFDTIMRKRFRAGVELAEVYEWNKLGNYLNKVVHNIICIKELQISNSIYKSIRDLPDGYSEKDLARYNRYLWLIKNIPMSRVLRLKAVLSERQWFNSTDFMLFMYKYYKSQVVSETLLRK